MKIELIVAVIIVLFTAQFIYMSSTTDAEYGGADGQAEDVILELTDGNYEPIAKPIWEPPSGEFSRNPSGFFCRFDRGTASIARGYTAKIKYLRFLELP